MARHVFRQRLGHERSGACLRGEPALGKKLAVRRHHSIAMHAERTRKPPGAFHARPRFQDPTANIRNDGRRDPNVRGHNWTTHILHTGTFKWSSREHSTFMNRTELKRHPERGSHDMKAIWDVVDEALICHLGVETPDGTLVLPMAYARLENTLYFHGAIANGILRGGTKAENASACVTITLLDGLVFAHSHFSHSMNYRCVVAFGPLRDVTDVSEKRAALAAVVNHAAPERAAVSRAPTDAEVTATRVVAFELAQASLKTRTGPPLDGPLEENAGYNCWTGVVPLAVMRETAIPCETNRDPKTPAPSLPRVRHAVYNQQTKGPS